MLPSGAVGNSRKEILPTAYLGIGGFLIPELLDVPFGRGGMVILLMEN